MWLRAALQQRKHDADFQPAACVGIVQRDGRAVQHGDVAHDRQAQARARRIGLERRGGPVERREHLLAFGRGDARAAVALLAISPGGIAEMALTARVLRLGVPAVTAFHVARMVVLAIGPLYRWWERRR